MCASACMYVREKRGGGWKRLVPSLPFPNLFCCHIFTLQTHTVQDRLTRQHLAYSNKSIRPVKGRIPDKVSSSRNNQQQSAVNLCALFLKWENVAYFRENCCCSIHPGLYCSHSHISAFILISPLKSDAAVHICVQLQVSARDQEREQKALKTFIWTDDSGLGQCVLAAASHNHAVQAFSQSTGLQLSAQPAELQ